ncbi:MAG TPA: hypothetical protein VFS88_06710 [Micavibrio sp.]|nr:hypothetical protein [Micavibrio sp.]
MTYLNASAVAQALGIYKSEAARAVSIQYVFNHFSKEKPGSSPRQRMKHAFDSSVAHADTRISLLDVYESAFFSAYENYSHDAVAIAALCSPFLRKDIGIRDFDASGMFPRITDETVKRAYLLQEEATEIKKTADLNHKGPRSDNDRFSREAYFLACINLFEIMYKVESSDVSYESLSNHLRYDLICAPRYVNRNTRFGRMLAEAVDTMEGKIVEQLKLFARVHLELKKDDDGPRLNCK